MHILLFVLGLALLIGGAELLVRGASKLAGALGISSLVIGLTVVAFGTSAPELAVSVQAGLAGQSDISIGNVIGSNLFNILFILGISAVITPLVVSVQLIRIDVPIMIISAVALYLMGLNGKLDLLDGVILFSSIIAYVVFLIKQSKKENILNNSDGNKQKLTLINTLFYLLLIIAGLAMLVLGSNWLVNSSIYFARILGVSELVIGLTIIAAGTSLPEVATSIVAAVKGERDIAIGNVVGSNIFNILAVLGAASIITPNGINISPGVMHFDLPFMIAVSVACIPIFFTGMIISRGEGFLFLGYYLAYTVYLVLQSTQHAALPLYNKVMIVFVIPITVVTLIIILIQAVRKK